MSEAARIAAAIGCTLAWLLLVAATLWRHLPRRIGTPDADTILIAYSSQTGSAATLAQATADALTASGRRVAVRSFGRLSVADLAATREALFLVATTGEGDAPDDAASLMRQWASNPPSLAALRYALLALGDTHYQQFCAFGRTFDALLHDAGATPLADRVDVDQGDPGALRHWQQNLQLFGASASLPDWEAPAYVGAILDERELLNAGGTGEAMFRIRLLPKDGSLDWSAGDVAEVYPGPANDAFGASPPLPHRDYSLASIPADSAIELVVRLFRDAEGQPGLGSGWLCERVQPGDEVALRVRSNPRFHTPATEVPMILVGNGTGISSLRAHLRARALGSRNWLIYGERDPIHDRPFAEELDAWTAATHLARLDRVFSRGGEGSRYVQHLLATEATELADWIAAGAALFVCGSTAMGNQVDTVLRATLGDAGVEAMLAEGRYSRDIY